MNDEIMQFLPDSIKTTLLIGLVIGAWRVFVIVSKFMTKRKAQKEQFKDEVLEKERIRAEFDKRLLKLEIDNERIKEDVKEHKKSTTTWLRDIDSKINKILEFMIETKD